MLSTQTIRRFPCWLQVAERRRLGGCGRTCATSGPARVKSRRRSGLPTVPIAMGEHPQEHLRDFHGVLQADGYAGFSRIYNGGHVVEAACWAHARRKFVELHEIHKSPIAAQAMDHIGALYAIEQEIRGRPPDERRAVRQNRSRPILDELKSWLEQTLPTLSQKSAMAKAIHYTLHRWEALRRYCEDGRIEIDNNAAERALRCVALGRKNFLFAGSDAGGERAAALYSLLGTAKLNGHNPEAFLRDVLTRIADHPIQRIDELLPWHLETASVNALNAKDVTPKPSQIATQRPISLSRRSSNDAYDPSALAEIPRQPL